MDSEVLVEGQKEGREDQGKVKELGSTPPQVVLRSPGPAGFLSGSGLPGSIKFKLSQSIKLSSS